jgi:hypothetical protein
VLEIVERILAALIILALLTLLIILAFPVPPRQTAGPPAATPRSGDEVARAPVQPEQPGKQKPADPVPPPPVQRPADPATDVGGDSRAQQEADKRAEENRRRAEEEAARRADADAARRAEEEALRRRRTQPAAGCTDEECRRIVRTRVRDCRDGGCPPRRPVRRPVLRDCHDGARDCCPEESRRRIVKRHNLPYWKDPRRYAAVEDDPDWYDERIAVVGPPPGVCPD